MLRIPFLPSAYPDETLGSLLTRLNLHNGNGLWRCLLEYSGYGRRTISQFYAIPVRDVRLDKLLEYIGYSYDGMLYTLSDLPFWLSFNNASGSHNRISIHETEEKSTKLHTIGRVGTLSGARYCPLCLSDDINIHGEPYLHRHHQLPVSLVCAKHGLSLRVTCISCGITVFPFNRSLLPSPPMRCQCGQDLRVATSPSPYQKSLQNLSQFAFDTLSCDDAPWTVQQVRAVLAKRLGVKPNRLNQHSIELLNKTYGLFEMSSSNNHISLLRHVLEDVPLKLRARIANFRAPEFCALLSATELTFEDFKKEVNGCNFTQRTNTPRRKSALPLTIENAQMEFSRHLRDTSSPTMALQRLRASSAGLFWVIRLYAGSWLKQQGYNYPLPAIPSISEDRARINSLLKKIGWHPPTLRKCGPPIRASLRDNDWLEHRKEELKSEKNIPESNSERIQRERAASLFQAINSVSQSEDRPRRIHSGLLAKVANISMNQAQLTISKDPSLQAKITAINLEKDRRMTMWAARKMIEYGKNITPQSVLVFAGLNTTRVNRRLAIDSIEMLSSKIDQAHSMHDSE